MDQFKKIAFQNRKKPHTQFDLLRLEALFERKNLDHSIESLHKVDFFAMLFIEKGTGYHTIDFTDYHCSKGTVLTIRKDQIQKFFKSPNLKGFLLLFTNDFLVSYLQKSEAHKVLLLFNELLANPKIQLNDKAHADIKSIYARIEKEYFAIHDGHSMEIVRSELHILITKLFRIKARQEKLDVEKKYLSDFIAFQKLVEQHAIKTTKVQDYAKLMGVSSKTLNTITKSILHKTAKAFIDEIQVKQIKRLLINTKLSVKEIAYRSGFNETTNFYKYFKRHTGFTPENFRATY
ncbi:MAG: helix-turn-helix transcriptional regulator [Bacteroidota bacterium]